MQFVGTDLVFGLLGYITLRIGGQQFGRDGCVNDIQQQVTHPAIKAIFRRIAHNITHQRLRHAGINAVHRHLVARIRRPTQCQLAHIARSDDDAVVFIGQIHQIQGTYTRLCVLVSNIMGIQVVPYIAQVLRSHLADAYLALRDA